MKTLLSFLLQWVLTVHELKATLRTDSTGNVKFQNAVHEVCHGLICAKVYGTVKFLRVDETSGVASYTLRKYSPTEGIDDLSVSIAGSVGENLICGLPFQLRGHGANGDLDQAVAALVYSTEDAAGEDRLLRLAKAKVGMWISENRAEILELAEKLEKDGIVSGKYAMSVFSRKSDAIRAKFAHILDARRSHDGREFFGSAVPRDAKSVEQRKGLERR